MGKNREEEETHWKITLTGEKLQILKEREGNLARAGKN